MSDGHCPALASPERHGGLVAANPCYFALVDENSWSQRQALIDDLTRSLRPVSMPEVLADLDRTGLALTQAEPDLQALAHFSAAFTWDEEDRSTRWMPQGISGSADAVVTERIAGREIVAVSWYHAADFGEAMRGVRLSLADVTDRVSGVVPYRHLLLVEPFDNGGRVDLRAIGIHAGGIAWIGDYLYVVETWVGLRVFDMTQLLRVPRGCEDRIGRDEASGGYCAFGYEYIVPEVNRYRLDDQSCAHRFSFVSVDHTQAPPRSLVTGEWNASQATTLLLRWPLGAQRLASDRDDALRVTATQAFFPEETGIQGATVMGDTWFLSCSDQAGATRSSLFRVVENKKSEAFGWVFGPEDLMYVRSSKTLWSASEFAGHRYVYSVRAPGE